MEQFTASEVRDAITWKYGDKLTLISAMLTAFADLLEAQEKAMPVAYAAGLEANMRGFLDVMAWSEGEFTIPLYTHPAPSDAERLAEALEIIDGWMELYDHQGTGSARDASRSEKEWAADRAKLATLLAAHSAKTQPAASVTDAMAVFEVVSGVEGPCLTISRKADGKPRHEYRLAGPKPWGGGNTTHSFKVHTRELREQIDAIEAALAAQENPNG